VLRRPDGPLDDTVPAHRPITLRDLLSFRFGLGAVIAPGVPPIQQAMTRAGLAPGPNPPLHAPDEWMRRLGALPLIRQPGERWLYHTGSDVLGVLIARASGRTLEDFLRQRLFAPLGMTDTGFHVPPEKLDRFVTSYMADPETGELLVYDEPRASRWGRPPAFASGGAGLVSTADDVLAFFRMLLNRGRHQGAPVLSEASVAQMTADQLTPEQKTRAGAEVILQGRGWGFGLASVARPDLDAGFPAGFGWEGGLGASAYADPARRLVGVLLTQRAMTSPRPPLVFRDFWRAAYA
jgi:CubicO group peptidase (beta-lactamase class C family)